MDAVHLQENDDLCWYIERIERFHHISSEIRNTGCSILNDEIYLEVYQ